MVIHDLDGDRQLLYIEPTASAQWVTKDRKYILHVKIKPSMKVSLNIQKSFTFIVFCLFRIKQVEIYAILSDNSH